MNRRQKHAAVGAAVAAAVLLVVGIGFAALPSRTDAPKFKALTLAGKQFQLADLRGRVVLLDFFATWCPPCRAEVPELEKLWRRYKDQGLVVIGVALESGRADEVRRFAAEHKLTYWLVNDERGAIASNYRIGPIPTTYIISPKGVITQVHVGFAPGMENDFERQIKGLLHASPLGRLRRRRTSRRACPPQAGRPYMLRDRKAAAAAPTASPAPAAPAAWPCAGSRPTPRPGSWASFG